MGAESLDDAGRVIDFGVIKQVVGGWIDDTLDHAFIVNPGDIVMCGFLQLEEQQHFVMPDDLAEPSAENIVQLIMGVAIELLKPHDVTVMHVRFYETPNNWTDAERPSPPTTSRLPPSDLQRYS